MGGPDFCSLPHHCQMGFADAVGCLCWVYDGCGKDARESILGGFGITDEDRSNGRSGSTLAGRIGKFGDADKINAGHGGHGLVGGCQVGGCGLGGGRVTSFVVVLLSNVVLSDSIKELLRLLSGCQKVPSLHTR